MKILKFKENYEYPKEVKEEIEKFGQNVDKIRYYVDTTDCEFPQSKVYLSVEDAMDFLQNYNRLGYSKNRCMFKTVLSVMTEDDINLELNIKKYNV